MIGEQFINTGITNELRAMQSYSSRGYEIFTPMGNSRADFIAVKGKETIKVQAKTAQNRYYKAQDRRYTLGVLTTSRNGETHCYSPDEVDEFFVMGDTMAWAIPAIKVAGKKTVMLESTAPDYEPRHGLDVNAWRVAL